MINCSRHGAQPTKCTHYRLGWFMCVECCKEHELRNDQLYELGNDPGGGDRRIHVLVDGWVSLNKESS